MRSSPSGPDPLAPGRAGFAHRGLHRAPAIPENTLVAFAAALEIGAGIETDLRLAADNEVIVFHDADAHRLCDSSLVIGRSTLAEVRQLRIGTQAVPTLRQLFELVDGRAPILLEVKVDGDLWRFGPALLRELDRYRGQVGVMSFDPRLPRWLKTNAPGVRCGWVVRDNLGGFRRWAGMRLAAPHFLAIERTAASRPWVAAARRRMPVYCWTVRTADDRRAVAPHVDQLIWEADGRP